MSKPMVSNWYLQRLCCSSMCQNEDVLVVVRDTWNRKKHSESLEWFEGLLNDLKLLHESKILQCTSLCILIPFKRGGFSVKFVVWTFSKICTWNTNKWKVISPISNIFVPFRASASGEEKPLFEGWINTSKCMKIRKLNKWQITHEIENEIKRKRILVKNNPQEITHSRIFGFDNVRQDYIWIWAEIIDDVRLLASSNTFLKIEVISSSVDLTEVYSYGIQLDLFSIQVKEGYTLFRSSSDWLISLKSTTSNLVKTKR